MDLDRFVDDLQERLALVGEVGAEPTRDLVRILMAPLDAAVRLVLLEALSAAADEISLDLAPGVVELRLRGGHLEFEVTPAPPPVAARAASTAFVAAAAAPPPGLPVVPDAEDAATTRTTLRLPEHLKAQVEVAAARDGLSVNAWLVRTVAGALDQPASHSGQPLTTQRQGAPGATRVTGWMR